MVVLTKTLSFQTKGNDDMIDITSHVEDVLAARLAYRAAS